LPIAAFQITRLLNLFPLIFSLRSTPQRNWAGA
jgi:hypothetical protein